MTLSTAKLVQSIKNENQDFEWYPTTEEIYTAVKKDMKRRLGRECSPSVLDIGAGDGRVLSQLTNGEKYAIEKSQVLINALPSDVFVIGTEFEQNTLLDKRLDVIFSNPPYSEFEYWSEKIIKEANSELVYLVIPQRWINSEKIQDAIKLRSADAHVVGLFDFENAERQARAKVTLLCIEYKYYKQTDPFSVWFDETFQFTLDPEKSERDQAKAQSESLQEKIQHEMVHGSNLVDTLDSLMQNEMESLLKTYRALMEVDPVILSELNIDTSAISSALRLKISGLKNTYWKELFDNLHKVTSRLTKKSREKLLNTLFRSTNVDFTASNAHAVLLWVIKNANQYYEKQLIDTYETMIDKANVLLYKSNKRVFSDNEWLYCRRPSLLDRFQLDYRVVITRTSGISTSGFSYDGVNGLSISAADHINDLITIADNLGFDSSGMPRAKDYEWESGVLRTFYYFNHSSSKKEILFTVRAYKKGTLHIKFNQKFILKLNVEFGRLKGWINSPKEASDELGILLSDVIPAYNSNLQLDNSSLLQLGYHKAA